MGKHRIFAVELNQQAICLPDEVNKNQHYQRVAQDLGWTEGKINTPFDLIRAVRIATGSLTKLET